MGRKRKKGANLPPRTVRHFSNPKTGSTKVSNGPVNEPPDGREWIPRLSWRHEGWPPEAGTLDLAELIQHPANADVQWICDSNFYIGPTDQGIWESLTARKKRLVLPVSVYHELEQWLDRAANKRDIANRLMVQHIVEALDNPEGATIGLLDLPRNNPIRGTASDYYINLLGMRKKGFIAASALYAEANGKEPSPQELANYCKDNLGPRAQFLAIKGEKNKVRAHKFNDEATVVMVVSQAIRTGRETVILTRDEDVYEQFYKMLWLLDTHYRAMLLAEHYAADQIAYYPLKRIKDIKRRAFQGEVILLRKPVEDLIEFLPLEFHGVPIHCILIKDGVARSTFLAEQEMVRVLDMKGRTGGLSTDRLDGRNCHIYLGQLAREWGDYAAIGHDIVSGPVESPWKLSLIDVNLALVDCEPVVRIREVDPNLIVLPPPPRIVL